MPRTLTGSIAESLPSISLAALLVKVTAKRPCGLTWPVETSQAIRVVKTLVLPLPAPAKINADWAGNVTAARCSGFKRSKRSAIAPF